MRALVSFQRKPSLSPSKSRLHPLVLKSMPPLTAVYFRFQWAALQIDQLLSLELERDILDKGGI